MVVLILAGVLFLVGGALTILFGLPVKEFSFGNTLILAGTIAGCTGAILLGLSMLVREVRSAGQLVEVGKAANPALADNPAQVQPVVPNVEPIVPDSTGAPAIGSTAAVAEGPAADERKEPMLDLPGVEPEPAAKPRRNLLFSSTSRKERERIAAKVAAASDTATSQPPAGTVLTDAPPVTFDEQWAGDAGGRERTPPNFNLAPPPPSPTPSARPPQSPATASQVTVLKSGVVDGMAYSLYSDGSIEAQLPEGMMRFASIDELRAYLDARS